MQQEQNIQIKISDDVLLGFYSNAMQVVHTKEEFTFDFMNLIPPQGIVGARVHVSPAHMKRIAAALSENIKRYESQFGTISEGESQAKQEVGFRTQS